VRDKGLASLEYAFPGEDDLIIDEPLVGDAFGLPLDKFLRSLSDLYCPFYAPEVKEEPEFFRQT